MARLTCCSSSSIRCAPTISRSTARPRKRPPTCCAGRSRPRSSTRPIPPRRGPRRRTPRSSPDSTRAFTAPRSPRRWSPSHRTLAHVLQEHGWATGGFTANYVATRFESGLSHGFLRYVDLMNSLRGDRQVDDDLAVGQHPPLLELDGGGAWRTDLAQAIPAAPTSPRTSPSRRTTRKAAAQVRGEFTEWVDQLPAGASVLRLPQHVRRAFAVPPPRAVLLDVQGSAAVGGSVSGRDSLHGRPARLALSRARAPRQAGRTRSSS